MLFFFVNLQPMQELQRYWLNMEQMLICWRERDKPHCIWSQNQVIYKIKWNLNRAKAKLNICYVCSIRIPLGHEKRMELHADNKDNFTVENARGRSLSKSGAKTGDFYSIIGNEEN